MYLAFQLIHLLFIKGLSETVSVEGRLVKKPFLWKGNREKRMRYVKLHKKYLLPLIFPLSNTIWKESDGQHIPFSAWQ